jgi:hypothetical protein
MGIGGFARKTATFAGFVASAPQKAAICAGFGVLTNNHRTHRTRQKHYRWKISYSYIYE